MLDVAIVGGELYDGSDMPPRRADVGIAGGQVVEIGDLRTAPAASTIDARGCIVTPGFIDVHTHLDAQLCWDRAALPTGLHGVTTVMIGMCGFGIAPCPQGGLEHLLRSLEAVEEIPYESSSAAISQQWQSFDEFLAFLARREPCVNVGAMVPHSALRYAVMGERGLSERATAADRALLVEALSAALRAGALGLATSRGANHVDGSGRPVPSRCADDDELRALVGACRDRVWQINVRSKTSTDPQPLLDELDLYAEWTAAAGARLTWTPLMGDDETRVDAVLGQLEGLRSNGAAVRPQAPAQAMTVAASFSFPSIVGRLWPEMKGFFDLDTEGRLARLADPALHAALRSGPPTLGGARLSPGEWVIAVSPSAPEMVGTRLAQAADRAGSDPIEVMCDLVIADRLDTLLQAPAANKAPSLVDRLVRDRRVLVGLGDSGAHVRTVTNFTYPTTMLMEARADASMRRLAEVVGALTSSPADFFGLHRRGRIAVGRPADVNVIDLARLGLGALEARSDLPNGGQRLYQGARGYRATLVNGVATVIDDEPTFAGAGVVYGPDEIGSGTQR